MPFKTILAVTGPDLGNEDLGLAARLCKEADAHLSALVVQIASPPPVGEYAVMISDSWIRERQEDEARLAARRDEMTAWLAENRVRGDVATEFPERAWTDEAIGQRGRYADLTLIGPDVLATETLREKVIEGALFSSGKPLLILPAAGRGSLSPKRVIVAWDARIEASRAVREALEMLKQAEDVRLVLVDPVGGENGHGQEPGADMATYLARHGVKVSVERLPSQGQTVAAVLRRCAVDFDADMLVMGGYGHSRMRQRIFGGVTSSMLATPPLPLFVAR